MKKSLLAVAAMTAFAGAAQAQSSVTVYGILDVGYVGSTYKGINTSAANTPVGVPANTTTGQTMSATSNSLGQSAESTSRLGFKGTEDLGGGNQALFTIETGVNPNGNTQIVWNRQTFAGLHKNGVGAVTIGTQYTPMFDVASQTDAGGQNNMVGNAIYSGSLQSTTGTFNPGNGAYSGTVNGATNAAAGMTANSGGYNTRATNALLLASDRMYGLKGEVMYAQASQTASQTAPNGAFGTGQVGGVSNNTMWGASVDYTWNKLQAVAAYQQFKSYDPAAGASNAGTIALANGTPNSATASFGSNALDNTYLAAATYDFGIAKAYLQYITRNVASQIDNSYKSKRSAEQIGIRSQLTPTISAFATYGMGIATLYGQSMPNNNFRTMQIGTDYYLSKRTNLYAIYGAFNQSSNGLTGTPTNADATTQAGLRAGQIATSGANYALGLRHTF